MSSGGKRIAGVDKLPQLQNLIKRDPPAYLEEFRMQKRHFYSEFDIFKLRPTKNSDRFIDLIDFMSHVAPSYKQECANLPTELLDLLENHASTLHPDVRAKLISSLILLRNRGLLDPLVLITFCLKLYVVNDKPLRLTLTTYIVNDIKTINKTKKNERINRGVKAVLHRIVLEDTGITAKKCVDIMTQLYRKRVWTDADTVNALAAATLNSSSKACVTALRFFLGIEEAMADEDDEEKVEIKRELKADARVHQHSKKTKSRVRQMEKAKDHNSKLNKELLKDKEATPIFPAIMILHDPQSLSEKLFKKLRQSGELFEVKLLLMNFISRILGCHQIQMLSFYSFLQRYLTSHQRDVTVILTYLVQACHERVPPEDLMPVVRAIAFNFITDRCSSEVITVGLNSVREIFARVPSILREDDMAGFVQDLAMYSRKAHKSVMMAANGVVNLVRKLYPGLLKKSDRGRQVGKATAAILGDTDAARMPLAFGEQAVAEGIEGTELLEAYEKGDLQLDGDELRWKEDVESQDEWEEAEEGDDDSDEDAAPTLVPFENEGRTGDDDDEEEEEEEEEDEEEDEEDEDDEDEDGWEDVIEEGDFEESDEEGEEGEDSERKRGRDEEDEEGQPSKTPRLEHQRVLTQEDFDLLTRLKEAYEEKKKDPRFKAIQAKMIKARGGKKAPSRLGDDDDDDDRRAYQMNPDSLRPLGRTNTRKEGDKAKILADLIAGRKEEKWDQGGHKGGLTNKEKLRKKNYLMVRKGKRDVAGKLSKSSASDRFEKSKAKAQYGRDKRKRRRT